MLPLVFCAVLCLLSGCAESRSVSKPHWVIVFDCGSTKTTMNLFQFSMNVKSRNWELLESLSHRWAKALSRFDPEKDADKTELKEGFVSLLKKADKNITTPVERAITPVFLYATAGLRALPKPRAEALLALARAVIKESHYDKRFAQKGMERVAMISGAAEGLYAWLAVNYLLSTNFDEQLSSDDFGLLDLGGGSTQISGRPDYDDLVVRADIAPCSLTNPSTKKSNPTGPGVFSKTFNNYGNSANIMKMVGAFEDCKNSSGCPADKVYKSQCLHPEYKGLFEFGPNKFKIEGETLKDPSQRFCICRNQALQVLRKYGTDPINSMTDIRALFSSNIGMPLNFIGISGYYYATTYMNNLQPLPSAGSKCKGFELSIEQFITGAKTVCENPINSKNPFDPYSCMQAAYLSILMTYGYHLPSDTTLVACKSLYAKSGAETKEVKANWALGVALQAAKKILEPNMSTINRK